MLNLNDSVALENIAKQRLHTVPRARPMTPELALALRVLEQAIADLRVYGHARDRDSRKLYLDAYNWVTDNDCSHPFSFVNLCGAVGIDSGALSTRLLEMHGQMDSAAAA